jgi:hypothetical protein
MKVRRSLAAALLVMLTTASLVYAQRLWVGRGRPSGGYPRWATRADFDGRYNFCRGFYTSDRREPGGQGWSTDYPGADTNFPIRLRQLTKIDVRLDEEDQPDYVVLRLSDPLLFHCPILHMEDVGTVRLSTREIQNLRAYLLKGGFLYVDDFWGSFAWEQWTREIGRVLPPGEYPIVDIPSDHPILHTMYNVPRVPQVPSINFWYGNGGRRSERGADSAEVHFRGIQDRHGRLMVVMTHNTDISDTWEREGENPEYFSLFSPEGYAIGINILLYAMTH